MSGFFEELKRRKVYRVAIAYAVGSWALAQGLAQVLPVFDISNSVIRVVIALLLIGFPVALVLAWVFDVTPQGIKATPTIAASGAHRRRNVMMLVATGVIISAAAGFFLLPRASARKIDKSIAVLPFENLSDEKGNAYFADGIQDDILTNLSKIGDLKVISRTSVMPYRGHTSNIREIAKTLGVSSVLEGSVRREGNRVRVNVQLINANNDEHLWANNYDRDLTDVFAIQTDLAREIAGALQAKLSPTEKAQMERWLVHSFERTAERRQKARTLAQQALQLQPDLPEAHLAMGFSLYYGDNDFEGALKEFEIAQRGLPNEAEGYLALGSIQRRMGKWPESNASLEKAAILNPKDSWVLQNLALSYATLRDFGAANKTIDRGLKVSPDNLGLWEIKAKLAVAEKGDLSVSEKAFQAAKSIQMNEETKLRIAGGRVDVFLLERKYQEALQEAESLSDGLLSGIPQALCGKYYLIGFARKALHDEAGARAALLKAKDLVEVLLKQSSDSPDLHIQLAKVLAYLGEKDAALTEARRATEILPESKDAFGGPEITEGVAEVYATVGENARAIELLEGLLSRPSPVTVALLKLSPAWDPLRKDPRFQALIDKYGAKV